LARGGVRSPFTSDPRPEIFPVWSPDGAQVAYAKQKPGGGGFDIEVKNIGGAGEEASLVESSQNMLPEDWSRDGRFLSYIFSDSANRFHLGALELEHTGTHVQVKGKPIEITNTPFNEVGGQFSPDRHWIAFESDETGHNEIYVLPFPGPGQPKIVSKSGGLQPAWSRNGRELFYVAPDGQLMAVGITVTPSGDIEASSPIPLFMTRISTTRTGGTRNDYAIDPRGQQRFLMNTFVEQNAAPITLVLNAATLND
jgi:eukaryotic-like serine/threonine-protein kinase